MRTTVVAAVAILAHLAGAQDRKLYEDCMMPTVMVMDAGDQASASGFVVRSEKSGDRYRNTIITAHHAVDGKGPFVVRAVEYGADCEILGHKDYRMYLYDYNEKMDLAVGLFESDKEMRKASVLYGAKKFLGDRIHHVGFGLADDARVDHGIITQPKSSEPSMFAGLIRTNAYAISGDSGGPLFDPKNRVIGVCHGIRMHKDQLLTHQSYFGDVDNIKIWAKTSDNSIEFVYNHESKTPVLPFVKMRLQEYKFQVPQE